MHGVLLRDAAPGTMLPYNSTMHRVLMNFQLYGELWSVHFIEADCKTRIGRQTRYIQFATVDGLRSFVLRCSPEDMAQFERCMRAWGRGSNHCNITDEQYAKLRKP